MKVLIVGGGIAGMSIALNLLNRGISITVIDQGENKSTSVATGLINPIVFRRTTKSWRADDFIPYQEKFYRELEIKTSSQFFNPLVIRRIFSSEQERNDWEKKQERTDYQHYLNKISTKDNEYNLVPCPFGSARVKNCFWVDSLKFMVAGKQLIEQHGTWKTEPFNQSFFNATDKKYKENSYSHVIFCEGYEVKNNPLFNTLAISPTKGQVLTIKSKLIPEDESLNRKCFVLPLGENQFKIGSTYEWDAQDSSITEEGKNLILENLSVLLDDKPQIIGQEAGIRPTTIDRRPFMGEHSKYKGNFVFNGLGTKGYMIAPLLANELTAFLLDGAELDPEVAVYRREKLVD
jgi:glycine/D-amino acid oxidase-like deaminating enzyme